MTNHCLWPLFLMIQQFGFSAFRLDSGSRFAFLHEVPTVTLFSMRNPSMMDIFVIGYIVFYSLCAVFNWLYYLTVFGVFLLAGCFKNSHVTGTQWDMTPSVPALLLLSLLHLLSAGNPPVFRIGGVLSSTENEQTFNKTIQVWTQLGGQTKAVQARTTSSKPPRRW